MSREEPLADYAYNFIKDIIFFKIFSAAIAPAVRDEFLDLKRETVKPAARVGIVDKSQSRNQPCPCGSGKKYKRCHGAIA